MAISGKKLPSRCSPGKKLPGELAMSGACSSDRRRQAIRRVSIPMVASIPPCTTVWMGDVAVELYKFLGYTQGLRRSGRGDLGAV